MGLHHPGGPTSDASGQSVLPKRPSEKRVPLSGVRCESRVPPYNQMEWSSKWTKPRSVKKPAWPLASPSHRRRTRRGQATVGRHPACDELLVSPDPSEPISQTLQETEPISPPTPRSPIQASRKIGRRHRQTPRRASAVHRSLAGRETARFDLASEKYAIPIHDIAQIIDLPATTPVPNAPAFLAGIFLCEAGSSL